MPDFAGCGVAVLRSVANPFYGTVAPVFNKLLKKSQIGDIMQERECAGGVPRRV